jgi:hypothetical protein
VPIKLIILLLLSLAGSNFAWAEGNYTLTINDTTLELDLGTEQKLKLPNGQELTLKLNRKSTSTFTGIGMSFEYPGTLSVATSEIDKTIMQHLVVSARGTLILVQTYGDIDATQLIDLMTGKMTDDDVSAGDKRQTTPHSRTLADGTVLNGTRSTLKGPGDDGVIEVLAAKQGRGGVMVITRIDYDTAPDEKSIIERFWSTLALQKS